MNNQEYHAFFRNILFQYISNNETDTLNEFPQIEVKDKLIETINYLPKIAIERNYAGFFEIGHSIKLLKLNNIAIYKKKYNNMDYYYEFMSYFHEPNSEFKRDLMILLYEQQIEHFIQLYYNSN